MYRFLAAFPFSSRRSTCSRNCSRLPRSPTSSAFVARSQSAMRLSNASSERLTPPSPRSTSLRWRLKPSRLVSVLLRTAPMSSRTSSRSFSTRSSRSVQRAESAAQRACRRSAAVLASSCQEVTTFAAASSAITSMLEVISCLAVESSRTHSVSVRNESLNAVMSFNDPQSRRNCSTDWFSLPSSFTCSCTCAVAFRSTFRQSSKRVAKCENLVRSTTACMAWTQSMASA
mmetsp:Transcript_53074/g.151186  ORF Transcript_53074/g.151186 Transcript_53074/m.151186 type:complete len:230 (-) Transcript_53074:192-881(-)